MSKKIKRRPQKKALQQRANVTNVPRLDPVALARVASATNNASAWSDLGVAYTQAGNYDKAKSAFIKAISLDPNRGASYFNLGNLELEHGFTEQAITQYELATIKAPENGNIHLNLGNALRKLGRFKESEAAYRRAIALDPEHLVPPVNLGNLFLEMAQLNDSVAWYRYALNRDDSCLPALIGLGNAYCQQKSYEAGEQALRHAIEIAPNSAEAHCNLSHLYLATDKPELAIEHATRAIQLRPRFAEALSNLGLAQKDLGDLEGAIKSLRAAVDSKENFTPALANLAILLKADGQLKEALAIYRQAMASAPNDPVPAYNASLILLQLGEFEYGWQLYENRWDAPNFESTPIQTIRPRWSGNKTLQKVLVWPEQGIGDVVMFASLFPQLQKLAPNAVILVDSRLVILFSRSFPKLLFLSKDARMHEDAFDLHIPIGSLPKIFCPTIESFKEISPRYLRPDLERTRNLRDKLAKDGKKLCGISWKSNNKQLGKQRSIELSNLLELVMAPDVVFINLQYGNTDNDISKIRNDHAPVISLEEIDRTNDIDGLCALIAACDYVISVDNSTVHFSGALGIPTTVLLPGDRDWRWTEFRSISVWYPATTYTN